MENHFGASELGHWQYSGKPVHELGDNFLQFRALRAGAAVLVFETLVNKTCLPRVM